LGDVFAGAVDYLNVGIRRNSFGEADLPVYTFFHQNMRGGEFESFGVDVCSVG